MPEINKALGVWKGESPKTTERTKVKKQKNEQFESWEKVKLMNEQRGVAKEAIAKIIIAIFQTATTQRNKERINYDFIQRGGENKKRSLCL